MTLLQKNLAEEMTGDVELVELGTVIVLVKVNGVVYVLLDSEVPVFIVVGVVFQRKWKQM